MTAETREQKDVVPAFGLQKPRLEREQKRLKAWTTDWGENMTSKSNLPTCRLTKESLNSGIGRERRREHNESIGTEGSKKGGEGL